MFQGRKFLSPFGAELNLIYDGTADNIGVIYDDIRLKQFLSTIDKKIESDNNDILESLKYENPDVYASMAKQLDYDNSLFHFKDLLFKSVLLIAYSLLEKRLTEICFVFSKYNSKSDFKKFRKKYGHISDIEIPKKYLKEEMNVCLDTIESDWNAIGEFRVIRKLIVHDASEIDDISKVSFFHKDPDISLDDGHLKIVNRNFVLRFLNLSKCVLEKLIKTINVQFNHVKHISSK